LLKRYKRFKDCKTRPKTEEQTVAAAIARNTPKATVHRWCQLGTASPVYVALDLCYIPYTDGNKALQPDGALAHAALSLA
jgi:hypothetical protein